MSRIVLFLTVGVLVLMVSALSFTLHKQTDLPPPPSAEEAKAMQAKQAEMQKEQMKKMSAEMKRHMDLIKGMSPGARMQMQQMLEAGHRMHKSPVSRVDHSDRWFTKGQDGTSGIAAAVKDNTASVK